MHGGAKRGGLLRGVTEVSRKRWSYLQRGLYVVGAYRQRNMVFCMDVPWDNGISLIPRYYGNLNAMAIRVRP